MRLSILAPRIPSELIQALDSLGIRTDAELLFGAPPLSVFSRLPPGTITFQGFLDCVDSVKEEAAAKGVRADKWLEDQNNKPWRRKSDLMTGVPDLDTLLGGFGGSRVLEISGDHGSGKTVLWFSGQSQCR